MFRVTVVGETPAELKKKLVDLAESFSTGKKIITSQEEFEAAEMDEEETEEVESPYVKVDDEKDAEGLTWDHRIHASTKTKTVKGNWKLKKGVDHDMVALVKDEQNDGRGTTPVSELPHVKETYRMETPVVVAPTVVTPTVAAVPAMTPPMPSMSAGHTLQTFTSNFPLIIAQLITEKKIEQAWVNQLKEHFGVTEIWMINDEQKSQVFDILVENSLVVRVG